MKSYWFCTGQPACLLLLVCLISCKPKTSQPRSENIQSINLKKGPIVLCGPPEKQLGAVGFSVSGTEKVISDFNFAVALLHSFEYDEAEKAFAEIIGEDPGCTMAYWGVAMSNFHPLWTAPEEHELKKGLKALELAKSIGAKTTRESDYLDALMTFYQDWQTIDHRTRCIRYEKAMESLHKKYPDDKEAAIFYALALDAAADPADKTYASQKKAGDILNSLYPGQPGHPGIIHYLIHSYDYPELAELALQAAEKYASIAPSSAHAQHMPSHIFTRLGYWDEAIQSNLAAAEAARCYAENTGIKGHWDEELHSLDYLMYAYLQKRNDAEEKKLLDYFQTIREVYPSNLKVAYTFAALPARYVLENRMWKQAADLPLHPADFDWEKFPWQKSIHHFARCLGAVHTNQLALAKKEMEEMTSLHTVLQQQKESYQANQVNIQLMAAKGWIAWKEGKKEEAIALMNQSADLEDKTEKHPVTPGEVLPARELLADILMESGQPAEALSMYEASLVKRPNRYNSLMGAALAAEKSGKKELSKKYLGQAEKNKAVSNSKEIARLSAAKIP